MTITKKPYCIETSEQSILLFERLLRLCMEKNKTGDLNTWCIVWSILRVLRANVSTKIPPPQHPVPPPTPVSVYLHRNVQKSMELNQTVQSVSVVLKVVLLLVLIATQMVIYHR